MKKLLLILVTICAFTSCAPVFTEKTYVLNFRDYTDDSFKFIPFDYSGDFEVLGVISNEFTEGKPSKKEDESKVYLKSESPLLWGVKLDYIMKKTIEDAKKLGANGLAKFELVSECKNGGQINTYKVSGVAVKFKE